MRVQIGDSQETPFSAVLSEPYTPHDAREPDTSGTQYLINLLSPHSRPRPTSRPRAFLIFFDFDSAEIDPQAAAVFARAIAAQRAGKAPRIVVDGHTDRAHSYQDSDAISRVSAWAVYDHLVIAGVPGAAIEVHCYGEERPLVATEDGVREPQNRRVEIRFGPAEAPPPR